jgi:Multimeric flavodoxin WrbA
LDQLNKYFTISQMPVISSRYWNMVHGTKPEDVARDLEGLQIMRVLARNMAWFLKCKEAGKKAGIPFPQGEDVIRTNFIR